LTARFAGIQLVAFDLDGTLVDSAPDLCYCLGCALASVGLSRPTEDETLSWIGDGVEALVERGLEHKAAQSRASPRFAAAVPFEAPRAFATAYAEFLRCYAQNLFVRTRLYPAVIDTLDELAARGLRLCCITNKRVRFALDVLEQAGIRDRFELVLGGDSLPEKKPSPAQLHSAAATLGIEPGAEADACLLVGDSANDYGAATAAGWAFAWASYGYAPRMPGEGPGTAGAARMDSIEDARATAIARIDSIDELKTLLRDPRSP
jgi:phosphoglycolate phosphatase